MDDDNRSFGSERAAGSRSKSEAVKRYIAEHGFGSPTPPLDNRLTAEVFRQHYYDKKTLMKFCRDMGIPASGLKNDLNDRIDTFLRDGTVLTVRPAKRAKRSDSDEGLSLSQHVVNYKSDLITREFFQTHIPEFTGFSALVQKQIKQRLSKDESFTYADALDMHKTFLKDKAAFKSQGQKAAVAHDSCQYNQFLIDYSNARAPKIHAATAAWMLVRNSAGAKTYQRYQERIYEILGIISKTGAASAYEI